MKNAENLPHESGIYKITNLINGHSYIGQSKDIYTRYHRHHKYEYKNEQVKNFHLYQAFKKYGLDNFKIEVLELCLQEELNEREKYWIKYYDTYKNGYNMTEGGQALSKNIFSEETEEKRRETREKNKSLKSENHPRAKLTNDEVWLIRERYKNGESSKEIWEDYKILYPSFPSFQQIISGRHYKDVGNIPSQSDKLSKRGTLTEDQVHQIRIDYAKGKYSMSKLGEIYNLSSSSIKDIINYTTYKHIHTEIKENKRRKHYRLQPEQVKDIRKKAEQGVSLQQLALEYKMEMTAIRNCVNRTTYKNIE